MDGRLAISSRKKLFPEGFYPRFLTVRLAGNDLLLVKALADVFCSTPYLEDHHLVGAAGQVMVAKAFNLKLNGLAYHGGDGGKDYLQTRIDTKTCYCPSDQKPVLWIPDNPGKWNPPKVYIGVALKEICPLYLEGNILGFATTSRIKDLIEAGKVRLPSGNYKKLGIEAEDLYPISWLDLYLKCDNGEHQVVMSQFLGEEDLNELIQCIPLRSNTEAEDESSILVSLFGLEDKESASEAI